MGAISRKEESLRASNAVHTRSLRTAALAHDGDDTEVVVFSTGEAAAYDFGGTLLGVTFTPDASFTHDATNYFTLTVQQYDATGDALEVTPATYSANAVNGVKAKDIDFVVPDGGISYAAGETFTLQQHQEADGLAIPAGLLTLAFVPNSDEE